MATVTQQNAFLMDVVKLLTEAWRLGFVVSGGELFRTIEQQRLYVEQGRSKTMASRHLERMAIDLNFFVPDENGKPELTYQREKLQGLGDFWESLAPGKNVWGGNWATFKDTPHFERRD